MVTRTRLPSLRPGAIRANRGKLNQDIQHGHVYTTAVLPAELTFASGLQSLSQIQANRGWRSCFIAGDSWRGRHWDYLLDQVAWPLTVRNPACALDIANVRPYSFPFRT